MKTLFLVRHAKADNDDESVPERERPLTSRARIDSMGMAERLGRRGTRPDAMLSSPALCARTTAELFAKRLGLGAEAVAVDERLFDASPEALLAAIQELGEQLSSVMVFGHKAVAKVAEQLSNGEVTSLPYCAVAELRFDAAHWSELGEQPAATVRFDDRRNR